jgi:hypothetical protein
MEVAWQNYVIGGAQPVGVIKFGVLGSVCLITIQLL